MTGSVEAYLLPADSSHHPMPNTLKSSLNWHKFTKNKQILATPLA